MALGITQQLPADDKYTYSKDHVLNMLAVLMGGRCAEEICMNHITTGAGNDLQRATELARKMVCEWGMSDMGPITFGKREEQIFLGKEYTRHKDYSEKTAEDIDAEIMNIISERYNYSKKLLLDNKETLINLAKALLERETLDASEIDDVINGKELAPVIKENNSKKEETASAPADEADKTDTDESDEIKDNSSDDTTA